MARHDRRRQGEGQGTGEVGLSAATDAPAFADETGNVERSAGTGRHPGTDTIAAVATGAGRAGVGIVRVSGPGVPAVARAIAGRDLPLREASYLPFLDADGAPLDIGLALRFEAPHSFTGEHVLELQGHGGPVVLDLVLARVLALGARAARPGEFSERAFLNDKLDLAQAEAIADLVESASGAAARAAVRSLAGDFSAEVGAVVAELDALRVWLEAALDFSEEDIDFLADPDVERRAAALLARFDALLARSEQGQRLRDGLNVVIAGVPNVGKSSLLNALAGLDRAIVTDVAGTTRDVLHEDIVLDGVPLHIVDTAGLRESDDPVEREGVVRARRAAAEADHVLLLVDASAPMLPEELDALPADVPRTLVLNKVDLLGASSAAGTSGAGALIAGTSTGAAGVRPSRSRRGRVRAWTSFANTCCPWPDATPRSKGSTSPADATSTRSPRRESSPTARSPGFGKARCPSSPPRSCASPGRRSSASPGVSTARICSGRFSRRSAWGSESREVENIERHGGPRRCGRRPFSVEAALPASVRPAPRALESPQAAGPLDSRPDLLGRGLPIGTVIPRCVRAK